MNHLRTFWRLGLDMLIGLSVGILSMLLINGKPSKVADADIPAPFLSARIGKLQNARMFWIDAEGQHHRIRFNPIIGKIMTEEDEMGLMEFEIMMHAISALEDPSIHTGRACG